MNMVIRSVIGSALLLLSFSGMASCQFVKGVTSEVSGYISFGNVSVQRDIPVGSVIATAATGAYNGGQSIAGCSGESWVYRWEMAQWKTLSAQGNSIYSTNIPGVGLRLTNVYNGKRLPYDQSQKPNTNIFIPGINAELIKTGKITGGMLTTGVLARASVANQFYFANVTLNGTNTITATACSVSTPQVNVPLGIYDKSQFNGVGTGTQWQLFSVDLNCDTGARINTRIDATADSAGVSGVMKLDGAPGDMAATGVGIQLQYTPDSAMVQFGKERFYYQSPYGGAESVQLQARYYQTEQKITAGTANGTATFTLTYK